MLIEFKFKNFKSFKDEQVFNLVASPDNSLSENLSVPENFGKQRLVNSAAMYGANASGKSNVVQALSFVKQFVLTSANSAIGSETKVKPFLLNEATAKEPTEFELHFIYQKVRYQYGFSLDNERVYEEWLIAYPKGQPQNWFERNPATDSVGSEWTSVRNEVGKSLKPLQQFTRPNVLFLSLAASLNNTKIGEVYAWFSDKLSLANLDEHQPFYEIVTMQRLLRDAGLQAKLTKLLRQADTGITGFLMEEKDVTQENLRADLPEQLRSLLTQSGSDKASKSFEVIASHQSKTQSGVSIPLKWQTESLGTRRLFGVGGLLLEALESGRVLVVDELDASFHPLLVKALIEMFHNPELNPYGAQLIFNTHDTTLLDLTLLRRDQIWFTEKDNIGASQLYSLLEYKPRDNELVQKGYLQGRYGAVPFIPEPLLKVS